MWYCSNDGTCVVSNCILTSYSTPSDQTKGKHILDFRFTHSQIQRVVKYLILKHIPDLVHKNRGKTVGWSGLERSILGLPNLTFP